MIKIALYVGYASCFHLLASAAYAQGKNSPTARTDVVMRFGGDVLLASRYEEGVAGDRHRAFSDFALFKTDDISMVNLEAPVTLRGVQRKKPFTFRMKPEFLEVLTTAGIDLVNIANNHIYDFSKQGLFDTIAHLDSLGLPYVGAGRTRDHAHRPFISSIKGKKIGFLGYYRGGEAPAATKRAAGVALRDLKLIRRDIRSLKDEDSVNYVVVSFHWGKEKANNPDVSQRVFARKVIDYGADAIVGHHPHVLQGIELYKNKVIAYSLGNLVFGGNSRHTYDTGILEIRWSDRGLTHSFVPVRITQWKAGILTGPAADSVMNRVRKLSSIFPKSIFN